jgi:8-oxo-dGTP pyrophosphatase MutT (NUDIX family)
MPSSPPISQCAAIAYRQHKGGLQIVLVTSMETRRWVLPKGNIENGMTASESAALEAYEEAGVEGDISPDPIGTYEYEKADDKGGGLRRVAVFPMAVTRIRHKWPEKAQRRRKWMSVEDAVLAVNEKKLKKLLAHFAGAHPQPKP